MDTLRRHQGTLAVNVSHFFLGDARLGSDGLDILYAERQYVLIGDSIDDGVVMETVTEDLFGGEQCLLCVFGKYRCTGEAEDMVFAESLDDEFMHITELRTVALIEDDDDVLVVDGVLGLSFAELVEFLYGGDDDTIFGVG